MIRIDYIITILCMSARAFSNVKSLCLTQEEAALLSLNVREAGEYSQDEQIVFKLTPGNVD